MTGATHTGILRSDQRRSLLRMRCSVTSVARVRHWEQLSISLSRKVLEAGDRYGGFRCEVVMGGDPAIV